MTKRKRKLASALTDRAASTVLLLALSYLITDQLVESIAISASFAILATILTYLNDRAWKRGTLVPKLRSLLPKMERKYEVDESSWLVIKGRALLKWLDTDGRAYLHSFESHGWALIKWTCARAYSLGRHSVTWAESEAKVTRRWLGVHWPVFAAHARFSLRRIGLTLRWRRVPEVWEMAFIDRMKAAEGMGISLPEVLRDTLPRIMGIEGTRVLGHWTGKRSMLDPETFVREMAKLFGRSSKQVVMAVFNGLDEGKILADRSPEEPKYQSLVDAINRADERKAMLEEMRERPPDSSSG
jgi:uncharacterized membrane protein